MQNKTWKICYKLIFGINGIAILLWAYIAGMLDNTRILNEFHGNYQYFTEEFVTTYTFLSNILVLAWLIWSGIFHKKENKNWFQSQGFALALSCYISVTFIVYNFVLIPYYGWPIAPHDQALTVFDHMINPIVMVCYLIFLMENKVKIDIKKHLKNKFIWIWLGTLAYCIFAMVRGELRINSGNYFTYEVVNSQGEIILKDKFYPYFFLNVHSNLGIVWFILAFIGITGMLIGFSVLYNFASNKMIVKPYYLKWAGQFDKNVILKDNKPKKSILVKK